MISSGIDAIRDVYGQYLPKKGMKYHTQVVWCLDAGDKELMYSAHCIHGKRVAFGEGVRSAVVSGQRPDWPAWPEQVPVTENVRLVIVAHGVKEALPNKIKICVLNPPPQPQNAQPSILEGFAAIRARQQAVAQVCIEAHAFCDLVKEFIAKSPMKKVERISLNMCFSAGDVGFVSLQDSPAQLLANACAAIANTVTGRRGKSTSRAWCEPKAVMDETFSPAANPLHVTENPKGQAVCVVGHTNVVKTANFSEGKGDHETFIFASDAPPKLKEKYTREDAE